jgi:hypothetical protein
MLIKANPDIVLPIRGGQLTVAGPNWTTGLARSLRALLDRPEKYITLDLSNISFMPLFEWTCVVAVLERLLSQPLEPFINIDVLGPSQDKLLSANDYIRIRNLPSSAREKRLEEYAFSNRAYTLLGFLESVRTLDALNRTKRSRKVLYPGVPSNLANLQAFYRSRGDAVSVLHFLTPIILKEDCKEFVRDEAVVSWRNAMEERFTDSPLFASEEVWRVLCHELAVNIWEHSGVSGFIAARIVHPFSSDGKLRWWCENSYPPQFSELWPHLREGLLELCIADAGTGFVSTLKESFMRCAALRNEADVSPEDILAFAFDELGSCKHDEEGIWISSRHALGRILHIVAKYGGALILRSDGRELMYITCGGRFKHRHGRLGYDPNHVRMTALEYPGAQLQVILPLFPKVEAVSWVSRRSVLEEYLPSSFRSEAAHVHGHLVPLFETLEQPEPCVGNEERVQFHRACADLCRSLMEDRPKSEVLIFDFNSLNWTPDQFETFLYLLQNALQNRAVLFIEMNPGLAQRVAELESALSETKLDAELLFKPSINNRKIYNELSERRFLETYSRVQSTVLAIDRDGKLYIFGLSDHTYEKALISLIENPRTISEVCQETDHAELKEGVFRSVLNAMNPLFWVDEVGAWHCIWGPRELANETSRVMSLHFDALAERSHAWRGREKDRIVPHSDGGQGNAGFGKGSEKPRILFNLSWQEKWRTEFLEASRILSRERYVDEAAQRLIYRLKCGLETRHKSLSDVKVLACATGPAMLLASAIHRWWPSIPGSPEAEGSKSVLGESFRPVVADLSSYILMRRMRDLPAIASGGIVIVQDILERRQISGELIKALQKQSREVLCVLSLIRLEHRLSITTITDILDGWKCGPDEVPHQAMIRVRSPEECEALREDEDDTNAFWVEPRSLSPMPYPSLRRSFEEGRDPGLARRAKYLPKFDDRQYGCLFAAGHYVYGRRHYSVAVDVRSVLIGPIGDEIADWLADLCAGKPGRARAGWERADEVRFGGDVTGVLMPLHSQILG